MRRISLALALIGAVAATGCGGGAKGSKDSGAAPGVAQGTFKVSIQNGQVIDGFANPTLEIKGGKVVSVPTGINCGVDATGALDDCDFNFPLGTTVVLTATAYGDEAVSLPYKFLGWAGDCSGEATCTLSGNSDKYVIAQFAGKRHAHPNFSDAAVHVPAYEAQAYDPDGAGPLPAQPLVCSSCHGAKLEGQGLALSCGSCHPNPYNLGGEEPTIYPRGDHFLATSPAFGDHNGWSAACQRCHTDQGFRDFMGALAAPGETTASAEYLTASQGTNTLTATTAACVTAGNCAAGAYSYGPLKCVTCHNSVTDPLTAGVTQVRFPSTSVVTTDKSTAVCAQCHQARESTSTIAAKITAAVTAGTMNANVDTAGNISFMNPHYLGAAATVFGADAAGWVQYPGNIYTAKNEHGGVASCTYCHDAHTGALKEISVNTCGKCHFDEITGLPVASFMELEESRQFGFEGDIDGDGNIAPESVKAEIDGLAAKLYQAMQQYATDVLAAPITYTDGYPYFMNAGGTAYKTFSQRLMKAAINYKWYKADPGAWAHNPRYAVEVLFDTINDLNDGLTGAGKTPTVTGVKRAFNGHFGAAEDPEPYAAMVYHATIGTSDTAGAMGFTSAACYQCHGGKVGFEEYLNAFVKTPATGALSTTGKVNAMQCSLCHTYGADMKGIRTDITAVNFPGQKAATGTGLVTLASNTLPKSFALCGSCHSGRENSTSIDTKIATGTAWAMSTTNPHYLGAAGLMLGDDAKVMYQYAGKSYSKKPAFWGASNGNAPGPHGSPHGAACTNCHQPKASKHTFEVDMAYCGSCHTGNYALTTIEEEYLEAQAELLAAIKTYATANAASTTVEGICYNPLVNSYWFTTVGGVCQDGVDPDGAGPATAPAKVAFAKADAKLLKATFNYQWSAKEPGAWAHNEFYVMQAIYDSIVDLGGTPTFKVCAVTDASRVCVAGDPLNRGY